MLPGKLIYRYKKPWYVRRVWQVLYLLVLGIFLLFIPGTNVYTRNFPPVGAMLAPLIIPVPSPAPYPVNTAGVYPGAEITASGIVIYDVKSGVYLYKRNESLVLPPASTTKILTALVALEHYRPDEILTAKNLPVEGQMMGLVPGERMSVENLLFGALVHSGNDAAWTLADNYPGGVPAFVAKMNNKARELALTGSNFANPVGYDDPNQKITPLDLARLGAVAMRSPTLAKMVAIPQITVSDVTRSYFHPLKNVNQLLGKIPGVGGIKTGWTSAAGENLVTYMERDGHAVIFVVLHSQDRFGETTRLIDWVFSNFKWESY